MLVYLWFFDQNDAPRTRRQLQNKAEQGLNAIARQRRWYAAIPKDEVNDRRVVIRQDFDVHQFRDHGGKDFPRLHPPA